MHISFLKNKKIKKKLWNDIMAMALPKQEGKKICNWFVAMPLPKQG